jgi:hypothetical protein
MVTGMMDAAVRVHDVTAAKIGMAVVIGFMHAAGM